MIDNLPEGYHGAVGLWACGRERRDDSRVSIPGPSAQAGSAHVLRLKSVDDSWDVA